jgi:dTDP-glucose 4,6-dehydratase
MARRVLLTGASGFVGSNVLEYLLESTDWDFVCPAAWRHHGSPLNIKPNKRVEVISHDLTGEFPEVGDFDYILNLASESHVDRSIAWPVEFIENNVSSTLQLLEYARKHVPKVFIQFSTDEVFGANEHEEWDVLLPANPYAASKAAQEMIAIAYWRTYNLPIVITNSNNIVGKNQDKEKFVPKVIDLINRGETVQIHTVNGKPGRRYWNPVKNVADALMFVLDTNPQRYNNGVGADRPDRYSLGGGADLDNREMASLIAWHMNKELKCEYIDAQSIRPGYDAFYPKTDGRLSQIGWEPPFTLEDTLREMLS